MDSTLIILINWQNYKLTIECLTHLRELIDHSNGMVKIALIENGSTNESSDELKKFLNTHYKFSELNPSLTGFNPEASDNEVYFIQSLTNSGFSGGVNLGCQLALALNFNYSFLLNSDALLPEPTLIDLIQLSKNQQNAIVGPQLFTSAEATTPYFNGRVWPGYLFGKNSSLELDLNSKPDFIESAYVEGSAMLLPMVFIKEKVQKTGYIMDDRMFLYCEDVDLCRSALDLGYSCLVSQNSKAFHSISNSSGGKGNNTAYYYITRNRVLVAKKWLPKVWFYIFNLYYISTRLMILTLRFFMNGSKTSSSILKGLIDAYTGHWGKKEF